MTAPGVEREGGPVRSAGAFCSAGSAPVCAKPAGSGVSIQDPRRMTIPRYSSDIMSICAPCTAWCRAILLPLNPSFSVVCCFRHITLVQGSWSSSPQVTFRARIRSFSTSAGWRDIPGFMITSPFYWARTPVGGARRSPSAVFLRSKTEPTYRTFRLRRDAQRHSAQSTCPATL